MPNEATSPAPLPHHQGRTQDPGLEALSKALKSSFRLLQLFILILILLFLGSGFFTVEDGKIGIVLHLGKIRMKETSGQIVGPDVLQPGAHWAWPEPIDKVILLPAGEQSLPVNLFWYSEEASYAASGRKIVPASLIPGLDGYAVSGDRNILHSKWSLNYRIANPVDYFLATNAEPPDALLESLLANSFLHTVSSMTIDQILLSEVENYRISVEKRVRAQIELLELGIDLKRLNLIQNAPPRQTKDAFDAAINAGNKKDQNIRQAESEANRMEQTARADASRIEAEAEAYKTRIVLEAQADANTLAQLLPKYLEDPEGLLQQLYFEGVSDAIASAKEKFIFNPDKRGTRTLRIQLESLLKYRPREKK